MRSTILIAIAVVALVATAGCLSGPLGSDPVSGTETTIEPTSDQSTTDRGSSTDDAGPSGIDAHRVDAANAPDLAGELPEPADCGDDGWVSFWGTGNTDELWEAPGELRTGWTVPANESILFVAFENTTAVGADHVQYEAPVTADGDAVPVNRTSGSGLYAVVMMQDANGNGEYDPGTDRPCTSADGDLAMSDWLWVDWTDD
jgi:hypothetical protein